MKIIHEMGNCPKDIRRLCKLLTQTEIDNRFTYHKPFGNQSQRYEEIRLQARNFVLALVDMCPESRELSLAITNLEQCVFWANASIARNETNVEEK